MDLNAAKGNLDYTDWSSYKTLEFDIKNGGSNTQTVNLNIWNAGTTQRYVVTALLQDNSYYQAVQTAAAPAVSNVTPVKVQASGWFTLTNGNNAIGNSARVVQVNASLNYDSTTMLTTGFFNIDATPLGLKLKVAGAQWLVTKTDSTFMQGTARDKNDLQYTLRVMLQNTNTSGSQKHFVSVVIWKGTDTQAAPVFETYGQNMTGTVGITTDTQSNLLQTTLDKISRLL
jgi:hypothetical protein